MFKQVDNDTLSNSDTNVVTRSSRSRPVTMPALNLNNIAINNMSSIKAQMDDGAYEIDDNQDTKYHFLLKTLFCIWFNIIIVFQLTS